MTYAFDPLDNDAAPCCSYCGEPGAEYELRPDEHACSTDCMAALESRYCPECEAYEPDGQEHAKGCSFADDGYEDEYNPEDDWFYEEKESAE